MNRLCANNGPPRDGSFTKGPAGVLDHAASAMVFGSKLGINATRKLPTEGFKSPWPTVKSKVGKLLFSLVAMVRHRFPGSCVNRLQQTGWLVCVRRLRPDRLSAKA